MTGTIGTMTFEQILAFIVGALCVWIWLGLGWPWTIVAIIIAAVWLLWRVVRHVP